MIRRRIYIEIENHVSRLKIERWESTKRMRNEWNTVLYTGIADGKKFRVETNGHEKLSTVIDRIVNAVVNQDGDDYYGDA